MLFLRLASLVLARLRAQSLVNDHITTRTLSLLIVTAGFIGLLWLTQSLIRRGMDDGSNS